MELWIRSQNKETLRLAEMLDIYDLSDSEGQCWAIEECGTTIGYYKSKKRALEVLDEIQNILKPKMKMITHSIDQKDFLNYSFDAVIYPPLNELQLQQADTWVYQMPKE